MSDFEGKAEGKGDEGKEEVKAPSFDWLPAGAEPLAGERTLFIYLFA